MEERVQEIEIKVEEKKYNCKISKQKGLWYGECEDIGGSLGFCCKESKEELIELIKETIAKKIVQDEISD